MSKVIYVGVYGSVDVPMPAGGWQTVQRGEALDTSDSHAQELLKQSANWALPEAPKAEPKVEKNEDKD